MKKQDKYLLESIVYPKSINEQKEFVHEGLLDIWHSIVGFFESGKPKHRLFDLAYKNYDKCNDHCSSMFLRTQQKTSNKWAKKEDGYWGWETQVEEYRETTSPEYAKCDLMCTIDFIESSLDVLKTHGNELCVNNRDPYKCESFIRREIPSLENKLKEYKGMVKKINNIGIDISSYKKIMGNKKKS